MIRSMYSGVAGMKAHQARMDVIGNNIANVNTYGFKSSRASFKDIYYQTLQGATAATSDQGGTNASQIGYGVQLGGVSVNQINPSTMESKICPHVFFAGEMIDVDALTGGYNLTIAFATGFLAGENVY